MLDRLGDLRRVHVFKDKVWCFYWWWSRCLRSARDALRRASGRHRTDSSSNRRISFKVHQCDVRSTVPFSRKFSNEIWTDEARRKELARKGRRSLDVPPTPSLQFAVYSLPKMVQKLVSYSTSSRNQIFYTEDGISTIFVLRLSVFL